MSDDKQNTGSDGSKGKTAQVDTMLTVGGRVIIVRAGQLLPADEAQAPTKFATQTSQPPQGDGKLPAALPSAALPQKNATPAKTTQPKGGKK